MIAAILFGSFFVLLAMSVPVGIALGVATAIAILFTPLLNLEFLTQGLVAGLNSFPLLAVLLFTLTGNLMSQGGVSARLLYLAEVFLGRYTGGLAIVTIVACMFFASISGTGSATVAAIGLTMVPNMIAKGYDGGFATSVVASSGGIGVIIPPSVVMIVYAITAEVSVGDMFIAGILPGLFIGLVLVAFSIVQSKRKGYSGDGRRYSAAEKWRACRDAGWALLVPVIILGGIYSGVFTPTESAAIGVVYGAFFGMFVYKELSITRLCQIVVESSVLTGTVLVIVGTSVAFGRILAIEQIPSAIADGILSVTENPIAILLFINVLLLIVGTFMETLAAIVILTPILLPIAAGLGVHPVHFGIVMIVNLAIGFVTPPIGANLFMAAQVGGIQIETISKSILGWIAVLVCALLVITFVPALSLVFV